MCLDCTCCVCVFVLLYLVPRRDSVWGRSWPPASCPPTAEGDPTITAPEGELALRGRRRVRKHEVYAWDISKYFRLTVWLDDLRLFVSFLYTLNMVMLLAGGCVCETGGHDTTSDQRSRCRLSCYQKVIRQVLLVSVLASKEENKW